LTSHRPHHLKGSLLAACNCAWGCPCNFEEPPSYGPCEGSYIWNVDTGHYNGVDLNGVTFGEVSIFPEAVHLGNGTAVWLIDEKADAKQRSSIESMIKQEAPFSVFLDLTTNFLGFRYVPFQVELNGIHSRVIIGGIYEMQLSPMKNPVTGEDGLAVLNKPTGFTSKIQELCTTSAFRFEGEGLKLNFPGKYGEFCPFEYSSE